MKRISKLLLAVLLFLLPLLTSCRQELCYDHYPTLNIVFDWEQEWERDYGVHHLEGWDAEYFGSNYDEFRPGNPEWVNMIRYFEGEPIVEHFMKPEGEKYIVEAGKGCSMLLYNGDTEYLVISDVTNPEEARATATTRTRAGASLQQLYDVHSGARTTNPPDIIYAAYVEDVPGIYNHEVRHYNIKMQPLVYTYVVMYEFEYGIEKVALARGALGGMAESVYLSSGVTSEDTAIILFDCELNPNGCLARINSFGAPGFPDIYYGRRVADPIDRKYTLNLELKLRNGRTIEYNYDITDQMKNQPRGGVIKIKGLRIEDDPEEDPKSGFDVEVTGWDDNSEIIDLPIGNQGK